MRPLIKPGLRRVRREGGTLQIGLTPGRSLLLNGLDAAAADFLAALDGTRDIPALLVHAEQIGVPSRQAAELLDMLTRAGFLDDAGYDAAPLRGLAPAEIARLGPDMAALALGFLIPGGAVRVLGRRRAAVIAVHGCGRVGTSVANMLAASGVGCIVPCDTAPARPGDAAPAGVRSPVRTLDNARFDDVENQTDEPSTNAPTREAALRTTLRATSPSIQTTLPPNRQHPDLAILSPTSRWPQSVADRLQASGVPHLPAVVTETTATLGPFVQPGRTSCLRCRDLHRAARDPGWPHVLAQLVVSPRTESGAAAPKESAEEACDTVLATHLAVQTVMHVLAFIEGDQPPSLNTSFDFALPYGDREARDRPPHPDCGCLAERF